MNEPEYGETYERNAAQMNAVATEEHVVRAPKLEPFRRWLECPKCGMRLSRLARLIDNGGTSTVDMGYCPGGKNETERVDVVPGIIATQRDTGCFGLFEEHLHLRCRKCGYCWLMHTRTQK